MRTLAAALLVFMLAPASRALALCSYDDVLYAHPALMREHADADRVVHVRVRSVENGTAQGAPWTLSHLTVIEDFKGGAPAEISYFTFRDSGAFYVDDIGGEYLLFLTPSQTPPGRVRALGRRTWSANFCGNSAPWNEVTEGERHDLARWARPAQRRR